MHLKFIFEYLKKPLIYKPIFRYLIIFLRYMLVLVFLYIGSLYLNVFRRFYKSVCDSVYDFIYQQIYIRCLKTIKLCNCAKSIDELIKKKSDLEKQINFMSTQLNKIKESFPTMFDQDKLNEDIMKKFATYIKNMNNTSFQGITLESKCYFDMEKFKLAIQNQKN